MKKYVLFIVIGFYTTSLFSQEGEPNKKILHALGYAAFTEIIGAPITVNTWWDQSYQVYDPLTGNYTYGAYRNTASQASGFSILSFFYRMRYNVYEPKDNFSIGLSATPCLGFSVDPIHGGGSLNLPIQAELGFGAGSTYNASSEKGGYIGLGFEINKFPIIDLSGYNYDDPLGYNYAIRPITFWVQPVISTGLRYWNSRNKMKEINLKLGFGAKSDKVTFDPQSDFVKFPVMTLRLSWITFLDY